MHSCTNLTKALGIVMCMLAEACHGEALRDALAPSMPGLSAAMRS